MKAFGFTFVFEIFVSLVCQNCLQLLSLFHQALIFFSLMMKHLHLLSKMSFRVKTLPLEKMQLLVKIPTFGILVNLLVDAIIGFVSLL